MNIDWGDFIQHQGVAAFLVIVLVLFLYLQLWPWYAKIYFPSMVARQKQADEQDAKFINVLTRLIEKVDQIGVTTSKFGETMQNHIGAWIQSLVASTTTQISILEEIRDIEKRTEQNIDGLSRLLTTLNTAISSVEREIQAVQSSIKSAVDLSTRNKEEMLTQFSALRAKIEMMQEAIQVSKTDRIA